MRYLVSLVLVVCFALPASAAKYRELFEREFLTTSWSREVVRRSVCVECHMAETIKPEYRNVTKEWQQSWHYKNNVSCHDCHGGDSEDANLAMSPERGYIGVPTYEKVPQFCGKCHIGILNHFLESGHGKAVTPYGKGPNCVTCHGAHAIQKAFNDLISEEKCSRCHSYERAKIMKQALFITDNKIRELEEAIQVLKSSSAIPQDEERELFRTQAEFRTLFHSIDVSLVQKKTDGFAERLKVIDQRIRKMFGELRFRKNFSTYLMLVFLVAGVIVFLLDRTYRN